MRCGWSRVVRLGGIGAVTAVLAVAGCGSNDDAAQPPPMDSVRADSMVLPIASYLPTADEYVMLQRAHGILIQKCMTARGFDWAPVTPNTGDVFGRRMDRRYRYVMDSDIAAKFGYHVVRGSQADEPEQSPSEAEAIALSGDDGSAEEPGGCVGAAVRRLSQGMRYSEAGGLNAPYPVREVDFGSYEQSQKDPRVQAALDEWSTCMAERGYEVRDPVNYLPEEFDMGSPTPSDAEVDMALWDVKCQERADVVDVWFDTDSQLQEKMIGERTAVFTPVAQENAELFRRATAVVEGADR